jgi:taurine dioxygenase
MDTASTTSLSPLADLAISLPTGDQIGARIRGLDPVSMTPARAAAIRELVYEHKLVCFEGLGLGDDEFVSFAASLGKPQVYFQENYHHPDHPEIFVSSNLPFRGEKIGVSGTGAYWHSDCSFFTDPLSMTMITPKVLPQAERTTLFMDLARGFDSLTGDLKRRLLGLRAIHEAKWRYKVQPCDVDKSLTELLAAFDELAPAVHHPVVLEHPVNGRKCLYLSSGFVVGLDGLPQGESDALLASLFAHQERAEFIHTHPWRANEITLWDNRQLNHCAGAKHEGDHSTSYRIGIYDEHVFDAGIQGEEGAH